MKFRLLMILIALSAGCYGLLILLSTQKAIEGNGDILMPSASSEKAQIESFKNERNIKDYSGVRMESGYITSEFYLYDKATRCRTFKNENIKNDDDFDEFIASNFLKDNLQSYELAMIKEMHQSFLQCKHFLNIKIPTLSDEEISSLLEGAVAKKDPSAFARKAFELVVLKNEKISNVSDMLIQSLVTNNPESFYTLSMLVQQYSNLRENQLISNALMYRACDAGYKGCDFEDLVVQRICQEDSICGSNLQETILMSTPNHLINEFENILFAVNNIKTDEEWRAFFEQHFIDM